MTFLGWGIAWAIGVMQGVAFGIMIRSKRLEAAREEGYDAGHREGRAETMDGLTRFQAN